METNDEEIYAETTFGVIITRDSAEHIPLLCCVFSPSIEEKRETRGSIVYLIYIHITEKLFKVCFLALCDVYGRTRRYRMF